MKKLIKLSEYVMLWNDKFETPGEFWQNITNYTKFILQLLNVGMFVPAKLVNGVWIVLEPCGCLSDKGCCKKEHEYQEALKKVIFKGFIIEQTYNSDDEPCEIVISRSGLNLFIFTKNNLDWFNYSNYKTIEDLIRYNIELNESIIKKLKL